MNGCNLHFVNQIEENHNNLFTLKKLHKTLKKIHLRAYCSLVRIWRNFILGAYQNERSAINVKILVNLIYEMYHSFIALLLF